MILTRFAYRAAIAVTLGLAAAIAMTPLSAASAEDSGVTIDRLRCEYLDTPLGISVAAPRLSWVLRSEARGARQSAYQILVASSKKLLAKEQGDLWDSGKVISDQNIQAPYAGKALQNGMQCWWKVRVWDGQDRLSAWSDAAFWSVGLLAIEDWKGKWIGQPVDSFPEKGEAPGPLLRKEFELDAKPVRATAYVAAMGYFELSLNGKRIGDEICSPPVSDYEKRAYYMTYDVTDAVKKGKNCAGVWLGRGWHCQRFPGVTHPGPIALVQIEIELANGTRVQVVSDTTWKSHPGPVTAMGDTRGGNLDGERYDARAEVPGWNTAKFDDSDWAGVAKAEPFADKIVSPMMEPNRVTETITPVSLTEISSGEYLFDMGRNLTGTASVELRGNPGFPVWISFIERKDAKTGKWVDYGQGSAYIPKTSKRETYRDRFMYHAFRYVLVKGLTQAPKINDVKAYFVQTDFARRGTFACSNDLLNRIYDTTLYTFRCVTAGGVSVDCPHRERLGYGGDGQITSKSALYAYDLGGLYTKWLGNWRDVQDPETGHLPNIAPSPHDAGGGPTWGAISILLPWDMYLHYGDRRVLQENYAMMQRYIDFLDSKSEGDQLKPYGSPEYGFLGDWVAPGHDQGFGPWSPEEWRIFFNNCFYAYVVDRLSGISALLGETQDAQRYAEQAARIRKTTHERYFKPEQNSYLEGGQAYLAFALLSGVTPEALRPAVLAQLEKTIVDTNKNHLDTGMHGTMFLLRCLNEFGRDDLAFGMINQKTYPGWGFMLEQGATTFWERWDGEHSQIHSTLLQAGEWFPRVLGGIKPEAAQPGFKQVMIDPRPVGDVTWAKASYDTIRGMVVSQWRIEDGSFHLNVEIPANTTGLIRIPAANAEAVTESGRPASQSEGVTFVKAESGVAVFEVLSGQYAFTAKQ